MGTTLKKKPKKKRKAMRRTAPYPFEFRLKIVKLFLEDGYSVRVLRTAPRGSTRLILPICCRVTGALEKGGKTQRIRVASNCVYT